jgi:hypothetical protein
VTLNSTFIVHVVRLMNLYRADGRYRELIESGDADVMMSQLDAVQPN